MHANDHAFRTDCSAHRLARRRVVGDLAIAETAAGLPGLAPNAQTVASSANDRVRDFLAALVQEGPEIGLQVAALFMLSSTTKGVTAICMHVCFEMHGLSYDMPIVEVWPEFGAHGKERATLRMALAHQTGVPQTPMFPLGERTAYHSLNYGHINGEILRRVDGRPIGQLLQEEICRPLGIAFAKNYYTYLSGNAVNRGRPPRAASNVVAETVFDALGLPR
jgi:CubicO group peptidase (beta-lactamase class C family)